MEPQTLHISRTKTLNDLKNKYISIVKEKDQYKEEGVSDTGLRLWKLNTNVSLEQLKKALAENANDVKESDKTFNCDAITYLECNKLIYSRYSKYTFRRS